jgi:hypothetical protein
MAPRKLWVLLKTNDSAVVKHATQVPTKDCDNVDDFIKAVKKELQLPQPPQDITLHLTEAADALERDDPLPAQNTKQTALVVTAPLSAAPSPLMKAGRQNTPSLEASCRKFLDAVAVKLSTLYWFPKAHNGSPTIGDVLHAVFQRDDEEDEGHLCSFQTEQQTHWRTNSDGYSSNRTKIKRGDALKTVPLSNVFTPDEWTELRKLNRKTTDRVHDGLLPTLSDGRPYIILPHADYSPEMVEFLQNIGFKAHIISDPSKLVVKHEYALW